jgi:hypothetical protein
MTIRAYIYSRFSSAKQERGDSVRRQHEACFDFANELGVPIDPVMHDPGLSAYTGIHRLKGALSSFIARVDAGEIARGSYLLVDSLDRLTREDETTALHMFTGLSLAGVRIVSVAERHVLPDKPDMADWIRLVVHASRAHQESLEKSRKVREAHGNSKRLARETGRVWHKSCPDWLYSEVVGSGRDRKITFHRIADRVAEVQRIFDMRESGIGPFYIAERLNEENTTGRTYRGNGIGRLLQSRTVLGEYQPKFKAIPPNVAENDGPPIKEYYGKPIIEEAQFHRVQAMIQSSNMQKGKKPGLVEYRNLFQGRCVCASCSGTVGGIKNRPGGNCYVKCGNAMRKTPNVMAAGADADGKPVFTACTNRQHYPYTKLEASILANITLFDLTKTPVRNVKRDALTIAEAARDEINGKVQRLLDMMEDGDETIKQRYRERRDELAAKDAEIVKLRKEVTQDAVATPATKHVETILELRSQLDTLEGNALYELRARLSSALKGVIDYLSFDDAGMVYAVVLEGFKAYAFKNGDFVGEVQVLPVNTVREQFTHGDPDREQLFSRIKRER